MPSFEIQIEFDVFCGQCGAGLCHAADTRMSRHCNMPQVTVDPCKDCMNSQRYELEDEIEYLKGEIDRLKQEVQ